MSGFSHRLRLRPGEFGGCLRFRRCWGKESQAGNGAHHICGGDRRRDNEILRALFYNRRLLRLRRPPGENRQADKDADQSGGAEDEPISSPVVIGPRQEKRVALYTELRDLAGQTVFHRWERRGQTMAVIPFKVGGDRWRVHSSKRLTSALKGQWQVVVTDSHGAILAGRSFVVR